MNGAVPVPRGKIPVRVVAVAGNLMAIGGSVVAVAGRLMAVGVSSVAVAVLLVAIGV